MRPGSASAMTVPVGLLRRRLRAGVRARPGRPVSRRLTDIYVWVLAAGVFTALAAGLSRPVLRLLGGHGPALPGAPGRLFAAAAVVLLLAGLARVLAAAGPVTASSAFRFWLLSAPVSRRRLLRRRFLALLVTAAAGTAVLAAIVAHLASVAVLPVTVLAALAAVTVTAGSVWGQASDAAEHLVHAAGRSLGAVSLVGFGSLATGVARTAANQALRAPPAVAVALLAALAVAAAVCCWRGYLALARIDVGVLRRGQGLWTAGQAAVVSLDAFMLADFLAEQRARSTGQVRSVRLGGSFPLALARSEWTRLRRRPALAFGAAAAAVVWWGCRAVLPAPAIAVLALLGGYLLVLPLAGTLKQLAAGPGLRAQFAPQDRWLARASALTCLAGVAIWTLITVPGLASRGRALLAVVLAAGVTAAACRTVTRPPVDYSKPPVPTVFGDVPLDLLRQLLRGFLLLAACIVLVLLIR